MLDNSLRELEGYGDMLGEFKRTGEFLALGMFFSKVDRLFFSPSYLGDKNLRPSRFTELLLSLM